MRQEASFLLHKWHPRRPGRTLGATCRGPSVLPCLLVELETGSPHQCLHVPANHLLEGKTVKGCTCSFFMLLLLLWQLLSSFVLLLPCCCA